MIEKLSLEGFRYIKEQLFDIDSYNQEYYELQTKLLSYDLSDIPFIEWQGFNIYSDENHEVDFSKTHANIDFELINFSSSKGLLNFIGCNIRNEYKCPSTNSKFFDEDIINSNLSFLLSDKFTDNFKEKYNSKDLIMDDLINLSNEELDELKNRFINQHLNVSLEEKTLYEKHFTHKFVELYKYSKEDYNYVIKSLYLIIRYEMYFNNILEKDVVKPEKFINSLEKANIENIKEMSNSYIRELILKTDYLNLRDFPDEFKNQNKDLYLKGLKVSNEIKEKYYDRKLLISDVFSNLNIFNKFPIENFIHESIPEMNWMVDEIGYGNLTKLMKKYPDFFKFLLNSDLKVISNFVDSILNTKMEKSEKKFREAVKQFYIEHYSSTFKWIEKMGFKIIGNIYSTNDLMEYDENTILLNSKVREAINIFGIENIKKLEKKTSILKSNTSIPFTNLITISEAITSKNNEISSINKRYIYNFNFYKLNNDYEGFEKEFVKYLDFIRGKNYCNKYDFIEGEFRKKYPEIFIDANAPFELGFAFNLNNITPKFLFGHPEYIPYLIDKNLSNTINAKIVIKGQYGKEDFIPKFVNTYGNEKLLELIVKYGDILNGLEIPYFYEFKNEQILNENIISSIHAKLTEKYFNYDYSYLSSVQELVETYPELFVDFSTLDKKSELEEKFYTGEIRPNDIKENKELIKLLKDKNLELCFGESNVFCNIKNGYGFFSRIYLLNLIELVGAENFLKICSKYGNYIIEIYKEFYESIGTFNTFKDGEIEKFSEDLYSYSYEKIDSILEYILYNECLNGNINYLPEDAPEFLKEKHPELFLSEDAPKELKSLFYVRDCKFLTFYNLSMHKEWFPYLKGKSIKTAILKDKTENPYLFDVFDENTILKLGIKKPETLTMMSDTFLGIDIMRKWYDKTGAKFIPDVVIMNQIDINDADKFFSNTTNWNKLMKLKDFSTKYEVREAMFKLAYSFGVFDGDIRGFNKVYELLTRIPNKIDEITYRRVDDYNITDYVGYNSKDPDKLITTLENIEHYYCSNETYSKEFLIEFINALKEELPSIDVSKPIIPQIYKKNEDDSYSLIINQQKYPKTISYIRKILCLDGFLHFITPERAHQLFGGFKLEYNPEFREFLLDNLDGILSNNDYQTYVAAIQKQFKDIKIANSNRKLTLGLAISYVQQNRYDDVEDGNEKVAEISAIAGYDQEDFDTLQEIYNYGKQRIFSSIPRIEGNNEKYTYEMLRLDDPLAMAIGTLTDCCQEIGNVAEVCMEHSMVDKNGRVFVIKDKEGNIVSQSWVWRNGNVLCFDNIEIPNKAFNRVDNRKKFTEEVYEIYKKASEELIKKDEEAYKKLFDEGKISKEEYEGLKLKKVTVGIGYNDIAETLKRNSKKDYSTLGPRKFNPPVDLDRNLYTSDSITQYILKDDDKIKSFSGQAYTPHNDLYKIFDDSNFTKNELIRLGKLEINQSEYSDILDIGKEKNLVSEIADLYDLDKENTKVIMNANFAIIYEDDDKIKIADLFYNLKAGDMNIEDIVVMQLRLAIEQIKGNKEIDISELDNNQKTMYNMSMNLNEEIDIEKGIIKNKNK